ncbi:hypothetical protein [Cardinium endosymbiont of Dermatophagoides farinae]|uniref:hypothetical protein n=1 Tax=Cardinium endosymbiont of Dermatophagoides farinae TaxID=2597823 RepID=UPI001CB93485|nr:hypothetical protein [Cardinium endosymbiont of Dermatophagoides farinae]
MEQCVMFLKEKLVNTNYHNELIHTHNEFSKSSHNIVGEDGKDISKGLLKNIMDLGSMRNGTIEEIKAINFDSKDYIRNRLGLVNKAYASTSNLIKLPFYGPIKSGNNFAKRQKDKIQSKRCMEKSKLNKESCSNDLSSKLNEAIDECKDYWREVFL